MSTHEPSPDGQHVITGDGLAVFAPPDGTLKFEDEVTRQLWIRSGRPKPGEVVRCGAPIVPTD